MPDFGGHIRGRGQDRARLGTIPCGVRPLYINRRLMHFLVGQASDGGTSAVEPWHGCGDGPAVGQLMTIIIGVLIASLVLIWWPEIWGKISPDERIIQETGRTASGLRPRLKRRTNDELRLHHLRAFEAGNTTTDRDGTGLHRPTAYRWASANTEGDPAVVSKRMASAMVARGATGIETIGACPIPHTRSAPRDDPPASYKPLPGQIRFDGSLVDIL